MGNKSDRENKSKRDKLSRFEMRAVNLKKVLLLLMLSCLLSSFILPSSREKAKGGVKTCTIYNYTFQNGKLEVKSKWKRCIYKYDAKGNVIEELHYRGDGSFKEREVSRYNAKCNKTIYFRYDKNGKMTDKQISKCDSKGNVLEWGWYQNGKYKEKRSYKYDAKSRKIEEVTYFEGTQTREYIESWKYDEKGNKIEYMTKNGDSTYIFKGLMYLNSKDRKIEAGSISNRLIIKYNSQGKAIEYANLDSDGSLFRKEIVKLDSRGKDIERIEYDGSGLLDKKWISKFDVYGNEIESAEYDADGSILYKWTYKYDNRGNRIEVVSFKSPRKAQSCSISSRSNKNSNNRNKTKNAKINTVVECTGKQTFNYDEFGNTTEIVDFNGKYEPVEKEDYVFTR